MVYKGHRKIDYALILLCRPVDHQKARRADRRKNQRDLIAIRLSPLERSKWKQKAEIFSREKVEYQDAP